MKYDHERRLVMTLKSGRIFVLYDRRNAVAIIGSTSDFIRHSGENPTVVLSEYQKRLANAWNINPHDVSLSPERGTLEAGAELEELLSELHAAADPKD